MRAQYLNWITTNQGHPRLAVLDPLRLLVLLRLLRPDDQPVVRSGEHRLSVKLYLCLHQDRPGGPTAAQHWGGEDRAEVEILQFILSWEYFSQTWPGIFYCWSYLLPSSGSQPSSLSAGKQGGNLSDMISDLLKIIPFAYQFLNEEFMFKMFLVNTISSS